MAVAIHRILVMCFRLNCFSLSRHCEQNKRSKTASGVIIDIPGHEARWLQDVQFTSIESCEAVWFKSDCASNAGDGSEVVIVALLGFNELQLLLVKDARWTRDIGAVKLELQKR